MSEQVKHTPTPWKYAENHDQASPLIYGGDNNPVIAVNLGSYDEEPYWLVEEYNARHIVKCVNVHDELVDMLMISINKLKELNCNPEIFLLLEQALSKAQEEV